MAITMSENKIPKVGDEVERVEVTDDGEVAYVYFNSGAWVPVHLTPKDNEAKP